MLHQLESRCWQRLRANPPLLSASSSGGERLCLILLAPPQYLFYVLQTHFAEGDYIIRQGATGDTFYIISRGQVKSDALCPPHTSNEPFRGGNDFSIRMGQSVSFKNCFMLTTSHSSSLFAALSPFISLSDVPGESDREEARPGGAHRPVPPGCGTVVWGEISVGVRRDRHTHCTCLCMARSHYVSLHPQRGRSVSQCGGRRRGYVPGHRQRVSGERNVSVRSI